MVSPLLTVSQKDVSHDRDCNNALWTIGSHCEAEKVRITFQNKEKSKIYNNKGYKEGIMGLSLFSHTVRELEDVI